MFSREILVAAPRERVWSVVSDIDNEPEYWHGTREVLNRSRAGNVTNRTIISNFMGTRIEQRVTLIPMESVVTEYVKGVTVGKKTVSIKPSEGGFEVKAEWDVRFTGFVRLIAPYVRGHIVRGTENALVRIRDVAEGRSAALTGKEA